MNNIQSYLETYVAAQKTIALYFAFVGVVILILGLCIQFASSTPFSTGLKVSALLCGIGMITIGIVYRKTEAKLLEKQSELFQKDPTAFKEVETERMAKVVKNYPLYQIIPLALIAASFLFIWIIPPPFWKGMAFIFILMLIGFLIVEVFSKDSIYAYYKKLTSL